MNTALVAVPAYCAVPAVFLPGQGHHPYASNMKCGWASVAAQQLSAFSANPTLGLDTNTFLHKTCQPIHSDPNSAHKLCPYFHPILQSAWVLGPVGFEEVHAPNTAFPCSSLGWKRVVAECWLDLQLMTALRGPASRRVSQSIMTCG